ncbi:MAG: ABC transporter ATP-binding protein [Chloroflexi bacterium]|nr:ABC transporter ATP-binding protein [Chloroflexota bacterium]
MAGEVPDRRGRGGKLTATLRRAVAGARGAAASLAYALGLLFRHAPRASGALLVQSIVAGLAAPLAVWAITGLVDSLTRAGEAGGDPWPAALPWLGAILLAFGARSVESASSVWLAFYVGLRVDTALQQQIFQKTTAVPLSAFERPDYYTSMDMGRQARGTRLIGGVNDLAQQGRAIVGAAGLLLFVFWQAHWLIALVLFGTTVFRAAIGARLSHAYNQVQFGTSPLRREQGYWAGLLASRTAAGEIRLFGLVDYLIGRWRHAFNLYLAETTAAHWRTARHTIGSLAVEEAVNLTSILFLLLLALRGTITVGSLVALLYGLTRLREFIWGVSWSTARQVERDAYMTHLRTLLSLPVEARSEGARSVPRPLVEGVRFESVSFTYPGATRPALTGIDLLLRPGERVALVGENGAGKTTLAKLLMGLYEPSAGRILVDGVDLRDVAPAEWHRRIGAVFQDFLRYQSSMRENIAVGWVDRFDDERAIAAAAAQSSAAEVAAARPQGLDTPLGKEFHDGVDLSVGQWQKLAIARAYVRPAELLILDEPASALDAKAEAGVYDHFARMAEGRTALLISHRLGSCRLASRIVVLKEGRIVEHGTHGELLATGGEYAGLYAMQAAWYR